MIKVLIGTKFKTLEGKPMRDMVLDRDEKGNPKRDREGNPLLKLGPQMSLRSICIAVLQQPPLDRDKRTGQPQEVEPEEKLRWADLAMRIYKVTDTIDLDSDEISLLKRFINKRYANPILVKQAFEALDPGCTEKKERGKKK